ncbi:hypothetical protein GCM10009840_14180 [Pseudolysinimonas kribbensis]|uniref:ABC transporter domain-containing protein n=1 Tax=Pseudolysinimonas kribbensis TaxID=433641 RepID=A0ABQ6K2W1_9MICO|nr:ABC transporter ATP-binding protein [Pseudolysinimonas kribbensis]GMA94267.1 hypothetical protein GCM10025881_10910 [Pseudolysinimonas kribbensis]
MTDPVTAVERPDIVRTKNVSKRFVVRKDNSLKERLVTLGRLGRRHREDFWALRDIDLTIRAGATVGLIGHNGSGKSTLLKVLGGIIDPTTGSVERRGRIAALLELGAGFHPDLTGRENVYLNASILGLSRAETDARLDDILAFASIGEFIDSQVKFYSSGMYVRLAFAVAVHSDPDLLLVDEVLSVGDEAFQRKCMDKIRSFQEEGRTIIVVSHSMAQIQELCDRVVLLNRGEVVHDGDPSVAVRLFRDLLESRRREELGVEGRGGIVEVSAIAQGRQAGDAVQPGDRLVVRAVIDDRSGLADWICAVQIGSELGQIVYATTSKRTGTLFGPLDGRRTVQLVLDDLRLGPGKYFINVSVMDFAGRHLHDASQVADFNTSDDGLSVGVVHSTPEFREVP